MNCTLLSWWFVSSFVLPTEREEPLTYFVEDIKEINYTACGYYLHRIKLLGLGNISSAKKPMWTRDTVPQLNKWWNLKINLLSITLSAKDRPQMSKSFPQSQVKSFHPLHTRLNCKLFLFGMVSAFCTLTNMMLVVVTYFLGRRTLLVLILLCISAWQVTNEICSLKLNQASFLSVPHKGWNVTFFLDTFCTPSSFITFISSVTNALSLWPWFLTACYGDKCLGLVI